MINLFLKKMKIYYFDNNVIFFYNFIINWYNVIENWFMFKCLWIGDCFNEDNYFDGWGYIVIYLCNIIVIDKCLCIV